MRLGIEDGGREIEGMKTRYFPGYKWEGGDFETFTTVTVSGRSNGNYAYVTCYNANDQISSRETILLNANGVRQLRKALELREAELVKAGFLEEEGRLR